MSQPKLFEQNVDDIPESSVPALIDTFTGRMHYVALHCRSKACFEGKPSAPHNTAEIRRTLVDFMGKLLDAFEVTHFGDPLPEEERAWTEYEKSKS